MLLSAGTTRFIRAGVFQLPALGFGDGNASLAALALPASLPSSLRLDPSPQPEPSVEAEPDISGDPLPGDPLRDELKASAADFPVAERSSKGDLRLSRLPPGLEPSGPDDEIYTEADPFLPDGGAPPLARLSRQLEPPATAAGLSPFKETRVDAALASALAERMGNQGQEPGVEEGAVPIDHSLAPVGGTSPAASRPDLASLDARTTEPALRPLELAVAEPDATLSVAAVVPTREEDVGAPMPVLRPDEGMTTAQKNARIAGLPGLDDGVARPLTLPPVAFTRAQICLATAVYFEARGEAETGQIAVAQVIINRVRSPFYPKNVCDVVYQGASAHRWGGCQFSFACDGIPDRVTEDRPWAQALSVAQRVLDAEAWLPEVGNATHYHANYVRPRWVRDMVQKDRIGKHIFYRVKWWA